jgi:hypothetical protein
VIGGVVLDTTALLDIVTGATIYGQAFVSTAAARGVVLLIPSTSLSQAWATVPSESLPLLDLLLELPVIVVDDMDLTTARAAGLVLRDAPSRAESDRLSLTADAHVAHAARARGWRILTRAPERLWAIDPTLVLETPPAS